MWAGERLEAEALGLLELRNQGELEFVVPDLFWSEIGSILGTAVQRNRCIEETARRSIQAVRNYDLTTAPSEPLLESAFTIARRYDRSCYDSIYVALAWYRQATFITSDEKLAHATAAYLPVKWLGAFQL